MTGAAGAKSPYLNIGVSGHRFLRDWNALKGGLVSAVATISELFPGRLFNLISPLAEGADRLVADVIIRYPGAKLVVPLPLPRSEYMKDFTAPGSKEEFLRMLKTAAEIILLPPEHCREAAYEAAGLYVLKHCEILIALWDGVSARGRGGTGDIIARAVAGGKPVCHIWAGNSSPEEARFTDAGGKHGQVRWFNFPTIEA
jgi:hypothetical protein